MSVSNFEGVSNRRTFSIVNCVNDVKHRKLREQLQKIREKYGVDSIWYSCEGMVTTS